MDGMGDRWVHACRGAPPRTRVVIRVVQGRSGGAWVSVVTGAVIPSGDRLIDERRSDRHIRRGVGGLIGVGGHLLDSGSQAGLSDVILTDDLRNAWRCRIP